MITPKKVLIVDDEENIRHLNAMILENIIDDVVIQEAGSGNEAIKILSAETDFDLIFSDFHMDDGSGETLYKHIKDNNLDLPFLLYTSACGDELGGLSGFLDDSKVNFYIQKPIDFHDLENNLRTILKTIEFKTFDNREYKKVRALYFLKYNKTLTDVYIKLSSVKYVKVLSEGQKFEAQDINKYIQKGINFLYITLQDYEKFRVAYPKTPFLTNILKDVDKLNEKDAWIKTQEVTHGLVQAYGVNKTVIGVVSKLASKIDEKFNRPANLKKKTSVLLELLDNQKKQNSYLYEHSYLLGMISCSIVKNSHWRTSDTVDKVLYASFFHDILIEKDNIERIRDLNDPLVKDLTQEEMETLAEHPLKTEKMLDANEEIPNDVAKIVSQHHERVDGGGFPRGLGPERILPLACVVIIAHDFVDQMYENDFDPSERDYILKKMHKKYDKGNFRGIVELLANALYIEVDS
jgi:response regulator RpfG family c-di-GMP phosphodiesterase